MTTNNAELFQRKLSEDAGLRWRLQDAERAYGEANDVEAFKVVVVPIARSVGIDLTSEDMLVLAQPALRAA